MNEQRVLELKRMTALAGRSDSAVLIVGETGTGKSTLAEHIHQIGPRATAPFITVNLASQHEATIEASLFGHERGAFTGADRSRKGRFELAEGGTLFLDEIGELSLALQARLLEFLQRKTITPLGSLAERKVNTRVICATNRDLESEVRAGKFREDLYHRIRVLQLELPALSALEGESFSSAIHASLVRACEKTDVKVLRISKEVAELLECYSWPGNFRELENVLEVSVLASQGSELRLKDLPRWFIEAGKASEAYRLDAEALVRAEWKRRDWVACAEVPLSRDYQTNLQRFEKAVFRYLIDQSHGNLALAARETGLSRATFYRKVEKLGLLVSC